MRRDTVIDEGTLRAGSLRGAGPNRVDTHLPRELPATDLPSVHPGNTGIVLENISFKTTVLDARFVSNTRKSTENKYNSYSKNTTNHDMPPFDIWLSLFVIHFRLGLFEISGIGSTGLSEASHSSSISP